MSLRFADRFPVFDAAVMGTGWFADFLPAEARDVLNDRGALLIRNAPIDTAAELEGYAQLLIKQPAGAYTGGVIPRSAHSRYVFGSTEVTPIFKVKLHNELAYQQNYPRYISFFCDTAPRFRGQTPVAHHQDVERYLPAPLRAAIMTDDVVYVRRYLSRKYHAAQIARRKSMFVPWQDAFGTDDKAAVEAHCRQLNADFEWGPQDRLTVYTVLPAARLHPDTGRRMYFNQLLSNNFSITGLGPLGYFAFRLAGVDRESATRDTRLASHGALSRSELSAVRSACARSARTFTWRRHDWLLVDNLQVLHGRNRFLGRRAIWVVMGD